MFHIKVLNNSWKHFTQTFPLHTSYFVKHTNLSQEIKIISGITFWKSECKDLFSRYFFLIFNKSAHSIKICLTVITALHATQTGASSFLKINRQANTSGDRQAGRQAGRGPERLGQSPLPSKKKKKERRKSDTERLHFEQNHNGTNLFGEIQNFCISDICHLQHTRTRIITIIIIIIIIIIICFTTPHALPHLEGDSHCVCVSTIHPCSARPGPRTR